MKSLKSIVPIEIQEIVQTLSQKYEVYFVGGCVRDFLLGKEIHDFDCATSATVDEMKEVLSKYKIIETLCKAGADINFKDADGETPLQVASNRMDGRAMTLLKKYGADTSIKNEWGRTPDETYREGLNNMAKNTKGNIK